jgi:hypothetical protein
MNPVTMSKKPNKKRQHGTKKTERHTEKPLTFLSPPNKTNPNYNLSLKERKKRSVTEGNSLIKNNDATKKKPKRSKNSRGPLKVPFSMEELLSILNPERLDIFTRNEKLCHFIGENYKSGVLMILTNSNGSCTHAYIEDIGVGLGHDKFGNLILCVIYIIIEGDHPQSPHAFPLFFGDNTDKNRKFTESDIRIVPDPQCII